MKSSAPSDLVALELAGQATKQDLYRLRLYISGITPRSTAAIGHLKKIFEERLAGRYDLEIIDIYQQPLLAKKDQIVAAPTLLKQSPAPVMRLVGDMSNEDRVLKGLGLYQ